MRGWDRGGRGGTREGWAERKMKAVRCEGIGGGQEGIGGGYEGIGGHRRRSGARRSGSVRQAALTSSMDSFSATLLFSTEDGSRCLSMKAQNVLSISSCLAVRAEGLTGGGWGKCHGEEGGGGGLHCMECSSDDDDLPESSRGTRWSRVLQRCIIRNRKNKAKEADG